MLEIFVIIFIVGIIFSILVVFFILMFCRVKKPEPEQSSNITNMEIKRRFKPKPTTATKNSHRTTRQVQKPSKVQQNDHQNHQQVSEIQTISRPQIIPEDLSNGFHSYLEKKRNQQLSQDHFKEEPCRRQNQRNSITEEVYDYEFEPDEWLRFDNRSIFEPLRLNVIYENSIDFGVESDEIVIYPRELYI